MLVAKFVEKFEYMATYSNQALYAPHGEIEHSVSHSMFDTYAEFVECCYMAEDDLKNIQMERRNHGLKG